MFPSKERLRLLFFLFSCCSIGYVSSNLQNYLLQFAGIGYFVLIGMFLLTITIPIFLIYYFFKSIALNSLFFTFFFLLFNNQISTDYLDSVLLSPIVTIIKYQWMGIFPEYALITVISILLIWLHRQWIV